MLLPLEKPSPDFRIFEKIMRGEKQPQKVPFFDFFIDPEVIGLISKSMIGNKLPSLQNIIEGKIKKFNGGEKVVLLSEEEEKIFCKHYIDFYYRMGYDFVPEPEAMLTLISILSIPLRVRKAADTARLSRGERVWAEEGKGIITSWEDFENFPWERMNLEVREYYYFLNENLPEGMKIIISGSLYEQVMERLLGYEGLFYSLYDQPKLVEAVFNKWGKIIYEYYKSIVSLDYIGAIFHSDDLGYKTGTMLSPDTLRELVFPWFKKYASLAHRYRKMYVYHCCGNVERVMEDLIEDVEINAFHSFQDEIIPVTEFKKRYGDKIATLGGVDMDKLCRLGEKSLRKYVRDILDECMPNRYALGSGNSIANYVPVKNYLIMLEEGLKWG